jgi:hypothetical protein
MLYSQNKLNNGERIRKNGQRIELDDEHNRNLLYPRVSTIPTSDQEITDETVNLTKVWECSGRQTKGKFVHKVHEQAISKLKSQVQCETQQSNKYVAQKDSKSPGGCLQQGALEPTNHCASQ